MLLVFLALFTACGLWQIQRAQAKHVMLAQQQAASKSAPRDLSAALDGIDPASMQPLYRQAYEATGRFDAQQQILLDNQVFDGQVGYRVWTPMILADGRRVLVDRGWVGMGPGGRSDPPSPPRPGGGVTVRGLLRGLPRPPGRGGDGGSLRPPGPMPTQPRSTSTRRPSARIIGVQTR